MPIIVAIGYSESDQLASSPYDSDRTGRDATNHMLDFRNLRLASDPLHGPKRMRQAVKRFLQEEYMMEMVHRAHAQILDCCANYVPLVASTISAASSSICDHFPCGLCSRSFSSIQARQGHHWKYHGHFSERRFVFSSTCIACGQCFWTAQRMQQHLRYSRKYGSPGCLAQLRISLSLLQLQWVLVFRLLSKVISVCLGASLRDTMPSLITLSENVACTSSCKNGGSFHSSRCFRSCLQSSL